MQTAQAEILLHGNISSTVVRIVTPAEIPILRSIHGDDAVINIEPKGDTKRTNAEEVERLKGFYGDVAFAKVFPGALPKLPMTLAEVGAAAPEVVEEIKPLKKVN
jgi:hypothetical protein